MEFLDYTSELNNMAVRLREEKEVVTDEDIIKAVFCINNICIKEAGDCLIFLSALNLCNAYAKQKNNKISYAFKKGIEYILDVLNNVYIRSVYVNRAKDNGTLYLFQIGNIQFSFHDEKIVLINQRYIKDLSWDGVRKQNCAKSLFNSAINNNLCVSNLTFRGKKLKDKMEHVLENYRMKKIDLDELLRIKI